MLLFVIPPNLGPIWPALAFCDTSSQPLTVPILGEKSLCVVIKNAYWTHTQQFQSVFCVRKSNHFYYFTRSACQFFKKQFVSLVCVIMDDKLICYGGEKTDSVSGKCSLPVDFKPSLYDWTVYFYAWHIVTSRQKWFITIKLYLHSNIKHTDPQEVEL